jgi:predicted ribosomally synthesized peptide with nif11-like leader
MTRTDLERLTAELSRSPALRDELVALRANLDEAARWAHSRGYDLTPEQVAELLAGCDELSDDDLEQVAGGEEVWPPPPGSEG